MFPGAAGDKNVDVLEVLDDGDHRVVCRGVEPIGPVVEPVQSAELELSQSIPSVVVNGPLDVRHRVAVPNDRLGVFRTEHQRHFPVRDVSVVVSHRHEDVGRDGPETISNGATGCVVTLIPYG